MNISASDPETLTTPAKTPSRITLKGQSIHLVPLCPSHANDLYTAIGSSTHTSLWHHMRYGPFPNQPTFHAYISEKAHSHPPLFFWTLIDPKTSKAVGCLNLTTISPHDRVFKIGHVIFSPQLQQTTAGTESMFLMARYVFEELGCRRYEWKANDLNEASKRAAKRLGFQFEGVFRQHMIVKGRNRDTACFSMLDTEWPFVKRGFEKWLDPENFDEMGRQRRGLVALRDG